MRSLGQLDNSGKTVANLRMASGLLPALSGTGWQTVGNPVVYARLLNRFCSTVSTVGNSMNTSAGVIVIPTIHNTYNKGNELILFNYHYL